MYAYIHRERVDAVPGDGVHRRHAVRRGARLQQAAGQVRGRARLRADTHPGHAPAARARRARRARRRDRPRRRRGRQ